MRKQERARAVPEVRFGTGCVSLLAMLVLVSGCSDVRDALGLGRMSPDAFAVVERPPLSVPPDFTLRPPQPGVPRPQEVSPRDMAERALRGDEGAGPAAGGATQARLSPGEQALLTKAKATNVDPNVRRLVTQETESEGSADRSVVDALLGRNPDANAPVVNAPKEAARLRAAKESGTSPDATPTPTLERHKPGLLESSTP